MMAQIICVTNEKLDFALIFNNKDFKLSLKRQEH